MRKAAHEDGFDWRLPGFEPGPPSRARSHSCATYRRFLLPQIVRTCSTIVRFFGGRPRRFLAPSSSL